MIKPIVEGSKVIFGPVRMSYVHLTERYNPDNSADGGKYCAGLIIPRDELPTVEAINKAMEAAAQAGIVSQPKWGGKRPAKFDTPLRNGDEKEDVNLHGAWYLNAKSKNKPGLIDRYKEPITDDEQVYSGMWGVVSVTFYPYSTSGNHGVGCALNNVMKTRDDERFAGSASPQRDFANVTLDDEELDL